MIYDAVEKAYEIVLANFATDMAAVVAAKSETVFSTTATIEKRQSAEKYIALGAPKPTLGVVGRGAVSQAKVGSGWRDNVSSVTLDYFCNGSDPVKVSKQAELAAEALLRCIDKMPNSGGGAVVFGAGELRGSITIEFSDAYEKDGSGSWYRRAQVTFPLTDRDEPV